MASVDKRPNGTWRARWREVPGGPQRTRAFARKADADRFLIQVQHDLLRGAYVDPKSTRVTVKDYAATWLERMTPTWRSSTAEIARNAIDSHVVPALGSRAMTAVRRSDVEAFYAALKLKPSTVTTVAQHLSSMMQAAVEDGVLTKSPAYRARKPKLDEHKPQPIDQAVLEAIEAALPSWMRIVVPLGIGAGLRQGEVSGLTIDRLNMLKRELVIDRQLVKVTGDVGELRPPKTKSSVRTVPLPSTVVQRLAAHLVDHEETPEGYVLVEPGRGPADSNRFGWHWRQAVATAKVPGLRYHRLRHHYASVLLSNGVNVKAVSEWLGHASPVITLSTYAHLMPSDGEVARKVLDEALAPAAEDRLRTAEAAQAL